MAIESKETVYASESRRLVQLLLTTARDKGLSISALERRGGVGASVFNKVLRGKVTLQFRHVLILCDALGIGAKDLFAEFYGIKEEAAGDLEGKTLRLLVRAGLLTEEKAKALADGEL